MLRRTALIGALLLGLVCLPILYLFSSSQEPNSTNEEALLPMINPAGCESAYTWRVPQKPSIELGNAIMVALIQNNCTMAVFRLGGTEAHALAEYHQSNKIIDPKKVWRESGVFPDHPQVTKKFIEVTTESLRSATVCVDMHPLNWPSNNHACGKWAPGSIRITWLSLVSWWGGDSQTATPQKWGVPDPWINYLANKTVLIVSVFNITGPKQYYRKDSKFPRLKELKWVTPPVAFALNFPKGYEKKTWTDALQDLENTITNAGHFDYALLSCGAFGAPLVAHINSLGKNAIYLGGSLQALFGIRGRRWKPQIDWHLGQHPDEASWWVESHPAERPPQCEIMENCAYM